MIIKIIRFFGFCLCDSDQEYIQEGYYSNAIGVESLENNLYNSVSMKFDCTFDKTIENCTKQNWLQPFQYTFLPGYWDIFTESYSCLGIPGPLGPIGPLSNFGPIGKNTSDVTIIYNPLNGTCYWCNALKKWFKDHQELSPLGENGPLGQNGVLTTDQIYNSMYHLNELYQANNFPTNLDITGVWGILGPLSVLGPLGILGPLGPLYISQIYNITSDGSYVNEKTNEIERNIVIPFSTSPQLIKRQYDLFEFYSYDYAVELSDNYEQDTSWSVEALLSSSTSHSFTFCSSYSQMISVIVLPIIKSGNANSNFAFGDFDLEIYDEKTNELIMYSNSVSSTNIEITPKSYDGLIDWIIFRSSPDECFVAQVTNKIVSDRSFFYRLYVVGDGFLQDSGDGFEDVDLFNHQNIFGSFQSSFK